MVAVKEPPVPTEKSIARPFTVGWPFAGPANWFEELDRAFGNFAWPRGFFPMTPRKGLEEPVWVPALEAFEKEGQFVVRADLPGLRREEVHVEVEEDRVIIRGERKEEKEEKKERYFRTERAYGAFYRVVPLPEGAMAETAKANFKDGVLEVTLALAPAAKKGTRHVEITG